MERVCIIGLGYIGLPTAALLANRGIHVTGVDINPSIVEKINSGKTHIVEPGLEPLIESAVKAGQLKATNRPEPSDVFLIIVPTPFIEENKAPDMSYVHQAVKDITPLLIEGNLVVLESTSRVGATEEDVQNVILEMRPELEGKVHIAFCPERAIPGDTLRELIENDRTVGGLTPQATEAAATFYKKFVHGEVLTTTAHTAELVKLIENSFRDVNIAFANELSLVCDKLDINVWETIRLANHHPRVNILQPGPGVGGHCIAIDPWFIVNAAPDEAKLIKTAREVNDSKPHWVMAKVKEEAEKLGGTPTVGLLGLSFKPNVDDLRESPSIKIAEAIKKNVNAKVIVCEPFIESSESFNLTTIDELIGKSDIVVMLTDHDNFKDIPAERLAGKLLIDTRGTFEN